MAKLKIDNAVVIDYTEDGWGEFKKWLDGTYASLRITFAEDPQSYTVVAIDDSVCRSFSMNKGDDAVEFESTYKSASFSPLAMRTKDGRIDVHHTIVNRLQNLNLRVFSFKTSYSGSLHNINPVTEESYGDVEYMLYDASGSLITDQALSGSAVKTVLDFEPHYDYEIVGGFADLPETLHMGNTDKWFIGGVGVPDLPPEMYGSIAYISEVNIEAVQTSRVESDGRATSYLPYKLYGYPTNKIRFYIKHPPGAQERFQIYLELFN